ncbi:potassium-transporting ATPase subunit A [Mangrovactinospora gilvigrisea]|uniref:Potassium-transporting ATPase potassium-binding subunit n=1 Tax=Mangrovactinospora gilvigrisea TaxID=1428644 RepID=A0A1J7BHG1_9ACTN|nr:potassium-transporting ATPase subunit KdpA [Mangrovactinospora gilvigrisea]OIV38094.1 potassium-transporting ATPase subunit A [Mangrovactinospora gilvigrisea]
MSPVLAAVLQALFLIALLGVCYVPFGTYMANVYTSRKHLKVEKGLYRLMGVDPDAEQRWPAYLRGVLVFSAASVLFLYLIQRIQSHLPLDRLALGTDGSTGHNLVNVDPQQSFNTAASFVSNTNWQSYSGETTMSHVTQMTGLAVQNFVSAAVGMAVAIALVRGFARYRSGGELGNFWVDLVRGTLRILLPVAVVGALILVAGGVTQSLSMPETVTGLGGEVQHLFTGPIASQEVIKELGTNGGGFFNANSAHPFENPNPFTNIFEIFLILIIPFSLTRTFGKMVGSVKQGYALLGAMGGVWLLFVVLMHVTEFLHPGAAAQAAGAAMEGKESRFGIGGSSLFAVSTTMTSTGAVDSFHSSFTGFGGGIALFDMMLGEVTPGGVGSGLYGMLIIAVITVFIAGLMVGRTPEYLGKKLGSREITMAALYILVTPTVALLFTSISMAMPTARASMANPGMAHGFTEVLYAFTSGANNNGSAFAGLNANTDWYNTAIGIAMLMGRFLPMVFVLALAGSLTEQKPIPASKGTLRTNTPMFAMLAASVVILVCGLTYFPALALGPLAEGFSS